MTLSSIRDQLFNLFLQRAFKQCLTTILCSIREQMFNHFTTHIKAMCDHNINVVLENKSFLFLERIASIKGMCDHNIM